MESIDVSGIHCSISTVGNAVLGYTLKLVIFRDSKADVFIDGIRCTEKERPYLLEVGELSF